MKNRTKLLIAFSFIITHGVAQAQRTVSLRQFEAAKQAYRNSPDPQTAGLDDGENVTSIKDVNSELNQFVGTWNGTHNGKSYEVTFIKKISYKKYESAEKTWDLLKAWLTVKDGAGNIIYTNTNKPEISNGFTGDNFQLNINTYTLNFTGNCYNESGTVFIRIKPDGKMSLSFIIAPDMNSNDCPNGFTPVLPISPNSILLTKQP